MNNLARTISIAWVVFVFAVSLIPRSIDAHLLSVPFGFQMGLSNILLAFSYLIVTIFVVGCRKWLKTPIDLPIFLILQLLSFQIFWSIISSPITRQTSLGLRPFWALLVFIVPLGSFWLFSQLRINSTTFKWLNISIILFGAAHAVIGYVMSLFPRFFPSLVQLQWNSAIFLRMESPLGTGGLAIVIMMVLPVNIAAIFSISGRYKRLVLFLFLLLLISALFLTASRGPILLGIVASFMTFALIAWTGRSRIRVRYILGVALAILILSVTLFLANDYVSHRTNLSYSRIIRFGNIGDQSRITKAFYSIGRFTESPIIGIGWGAVPIRYAESILDASWSVTIGDPHGLYYTIIAELGMAGLIMFCFLFYRILQLGLQHIRFKKPIVGDYQRFGIALTMSAASMIIESLLTSQLLYNQKTASLFWIVTGLLLLSTHGEIAAESNRSLTSD